jgi:hypothetical protein
MQPSFSAFGQIPLSAQIALTPGYLVVCKDVPEGTSGSFQNGGNFHFEGSITFPDGAVTSVGTFIRAGTCEFVFSSNQDPHIVFGENIPDGDFDNGEPGWHLVSVTMITTNADGTVQTVELTGNNIGTVLNPVDCTIDAGRGCLLIFHNAPDTPPPPPGKTFTIGPSSMEGHLKITAGTWFNGGYSFKFISNAHLATQFTVAARVEVTVTCPYGGGPGGTILIPLGTVTYNVPAGNTNWLPTGDANSILSWMGAVRTPDLCGGFPMDNAKGAVFTATVSQNPPSGSLVDFRFKYRNPAAKGKVDTNCTDASEPKRNDAATCGASWSETVRDP